MAARSLVATNHYAIVVAVRNKIVVVSAAI